MTVGFWNQERTQISVANSKDTSFLAKATDSIDKQYRGIVSFNTRKPVLNNATVYHQYN